MAINAKAEPQSGGSFVEQNPLDAGNYPARLVQVIDLGVQNQKPFEGKEKPPAHSIAVTYELSHEFMLDEDGNPLPDKPRWYSEDFPFYNLEADRAKSTLRYKAIDTQGTVDGDWMLMVGMPCQVMLTKVPDKKSEGSFKNYVGNVSPAANMPGYTQPELVNVPKVFDLDHPDLEIFKGLPEWLQKKIKGNLEYAGSPLAVLLGDSGTVAPTASNPPPAPSAPAPTPPPPPAPSAPTPPAPQENEVVGSEGKE